MQRPSQAERYRETMTKGADELYAKTKHYSEEVNQVNGYANRLNALRQQIIAERNFNEQVKLLKELDDHLKKYQEMIGRLKEVHTILEKEYHPGFASHAELKAIKEKVDSIFSNQDKVVNDSSKFISSEVRVQERIKDLEDVLNDLYVRIKDLQTSIADLIAHKQMDEVEKRQTEFSAQVKKAIDLIKEINQDTNSRGFEISDSDKLIAQLHEAKDTINAINLANYQSEIQKYQLLPARKSIFNVKKSINKQLMEDFVHDEQNELRDELMPHLKAINALNFKPELMTNLKKEISSAGNYKAKQRLFSNSNFALYKSAFEAAQQAKEIFSKYPAEYAELADLKAAKEKMEEILNTAESYPSLNNFNTSYKDINSLEEIFRELDIGLKSFRQDIQDKVAMEKQVNALMSMYKDIEDAIYLIAKINQDSRSNPEGFKIIDSYKLVKQLRDLSEQLGLIDLNGSIELIEDILLPTSDLIWNIKNAFNMQLTSKLRPELEKPIPQTTIHELPDAIVTSEIFKHVKPKDAAMFKATSKKYHDVVTQMKFEPLVLFDGFLKYKGSSIIPRVELYRNTNEYSELEKKYKELEKKYEKYEDRKNMAIQDVITIFLYAQVTKDIYNLDWRMLTSALNRLIDLDEKNNLDLNDNEKKVKDIIYPDWKSRLNEMRLIALLICFEISSKEEKQKIAGDIKVLLNSRLSGYVNLSGTDLGPVYAMGLTSVLSVVNLAGANIKNAKLPNKNPDLSDFIDSATLLPSYAFTSVESFKSELDNLYQQVKGHKDEGVLLEIIRKNLACLLKNEKDMTINNMNEYEDKVQGIKPETVLQMIDIALKHPLSGLPAKPKSFFQRDSDLKKALLQGRKNVLKELKAEQANQTRRP